MTVSQVHEALGRFSIELKPNIPRDVLDAIEYFGHVAVIPGRMNARDYNDGTLDAARYVGVVRKKKITDSAASASKSISSNTQESAGTSITLEGAGMNFWLGDEDDKGSIIEDEIALNTVNFSTAISALLPPAVGMGTVGGVAGSYSGVHQWQTPRKAIQYVCQTMEQPADPNNLLTTNNSSFESTGGVGGWTAASNCSIAQSSLYSYLGTKSMQVTPSSVGAMTAKTNGNSNGASVTEGLTYTAYFWVLPTGVSCYARVGIDYRTSGGSLVTSASTDPWLTLPQNAWTQVSRSITVPTGSSITVADFLVNLTSNATGDKFYVDNVVVTVSTTPTPTSFRVNNRGNIDAGPESNLYVTTPRCILVRQGSLQGEDLSIKAVPGNLHLDQDMEDFSTRVVILAGSDGLQFSVGEADIGTISPGTNIYKDIHGNPLRLTKLVSESETTDTNADTRAELALRDIITPHRDLTLDTNDYDIYGSFDIGDYVYIYDPDSNLVDTANEVTIRGVRLNPIKLQVTESEWPVTSDYSVAYRANDGTWYDLTDYLMPEDDTFTTATIGNFKRTLDNNLQSVESRLGSTLAPDNLTPDQVSWVVGSFQAVCYLDSHGYARAQQKIVWSVPANTDGTAITDGDHYEIQWKLNTGHLYGQTWGAASTKQWGQLYTWGQPIQADTVQYQSMNVGWGAVSAVVNDLAAGTAYDFRIRAIDTSNNQGAWSAVTTVLTAEDNIPPSQPAAPTVAASLIAVQVTTDMGQNSGGSFNLEPDLAYFEVHAEYEPGFTPSNTTKLGNLLANQSMMDAQTPAVGTFQTSNTNEIWVKLVAVDKSGNRSQASPASNVTATLIDDQHITSLTVSKVTAGEITVDWLLSGTLKTGVDGQRLELNSSGLQAFNDQGDLTTNISSDPAVDRDFISWRGSSGNVLASVNSLGSGSFQDLDAAGTLTVQGTDLLAELLKRPKGVVAYGNWSTSTYDISQPVHGQEYGYMEVAFVAEAGRMYKISTYGETSASSTDARPSWNIRYTTDGSRPTTSSASVNQEIFYNGSAVNDHVTHFYSFYATFPPGQVRLLWGINGSGPGDQTIYASFGPSQFTVEDAGDISLFNNVAVRNDGYPESTTTTPDTGGVAGNVKTYYATWTRSYQGDDSLRDSTDVGGYDDTMFQGRYSSTYGQQHSIAGFDYSSIMNDLNGATINKVELYLLADHWYYDYGTALIGTHDYTSAPGTWSDSRVNQNRLTVSNWNKAQGKWVTLPLAWATEFQSGTSKGISLGPTTSTDFQYYGYFRGSGTDAYRPKLRFTLTT